MYDCLWRKNFSLYIPEQYEREQEQKRLEEENEKKQQEEAQKKAKEEKEKCGVDGK